MQDDQTTFLPSAAVRARYGVSDMSLWRWLRNEATGFPKPFRVGKRRFWKLAELEAWEDVRTADSGLDAADKKTGAQNASA